MRNWDAVTGQLPHLLYVYNGMYGQGFKYEDNYLKKI